MKIGADSSIGLALVGMFLILFYQKIFYVNSISWWAVIIPSAILLFIELISLFFVYFTVGSYRFKGNKKE